MVGAKPVAPLLVALLLSACGGDRPPEKSTEQAPSRTTSGALLGDWGVETQYLDENVNPGDDFYRYVNGGWLDTAELPAGLPMMSSFMHVRLETEEQIGAIIEEILDGDWPENTPQGELEDFYLSYMDTEAIKCPRCLPRSMTAIQIASLS